MYTTFCRQKAPYMYTEKASHKFRRYLYLFVDKNQACQLKKKCRLNLSITPAGKNDADIVK